MFGFLKSKVVPKNPHAAAEASVKHANKVWDGADLEVRTSLLKRVVDVQDTTLFLAYVHATWHQIPESTRLKLALAVMAREDIAALTKRMNHIENMGRKVGETVAECFSIEQFNEFFGQKTLAADWVLQDALGIWYSLGRFCLLITIGTLGGVREADIPILIKAGEQTLLISWNMTEQTMRRFEGFNGTKLASAFAIYKSISDGEGFARFFALFINEIIGNDPSFSPSDFSLTGLERLLRGQELDLDLFLPVEISSMFVKVKSALHEYLRANLGGKP